MSEVPDPNEHPVFDELAVAGETIGAEFQAQLTEVQDQFITEFQTLETARYAAFMRTMVDADAQATLQFRSDERDAVTAALREHLNELRHEFAELGWSDEQLQKLADPVRLQDYHHYAIDSFQLSEGRMTHQQRNEESLADRTGYPVSCYEYTIIASPSNRPRVILNRYDTKYDPQGSVVERRTIFTRPASIDEVQALTTITQTISSDLVSFYEAVGRHE